MADAQATLTTPETTTATKVVVSSISITRTGALLSFEFQDTDGTVRRNFSYATVSNADLVSLVTAMGTARASETGTMPRKMNFRVIGWMADNNYFTNTSGQSIAVTVVP